MRLSHHAPTFAGDMKLLHFMSIAKPYGKGTSGNQPDTTFLPEERLQHANKRRSPVLLPFPQVEEMLRCFSAASKIPSLSKPQFYSENGMAGFVPPRAKLFSALALLLPFLG